MKPNYLIDFPIPISQLPPLLRSMLEPAEGDARHKVAVAVRQELDPHGPNREHLHMLMACVPEDDLDNLQVLSETRDGVVFFSTPDVRDQGGLADFVLTVSGYDFIVAAWGDGSFYSYNLAEKVWMGLGLSPRCIGPVAELCRSFNRILCTKGEYTWDQNQQQNLDRKLCA